MTTYSIKYKKDILEVVVEGHTGYEDEGKDIVCSSISTATILAANVIANLGYNVLEHSQNDGFLNFKCERNETTEKIIKSLEDILNSLSKQYPLYVKSKS